MLTVSQIAFFADLAGPLAELACARKLIKVIKVSQNEQAGQFNDSQEACEGLFSWRHLAVDCNYIFHGHFVRQ